MELHFNDFGPIKEGSIDLDKSLIVLTGPNNSGKSYASYAVYGLYKMFDDEYAANFNSILRENLKGKLPKVVEVSPGKLTLDLVGFFKALSVDLVPVLNKSFSQILPILFNSDKLAGFIEIRDNIVQDVIGEIEGPAFELPINLGEVTMTFRKPANSGVFEILIASPKDNEDNSVEVDSSIELLIFQLVFESIKSAFSKVFFFPAERTALNQFSNEIVTSRSKRNDDAHNRVNRIVEQIIASQKSRNGKKNTSSSGHQVMPVQDYLYLMNDLANISKESSDFVYLADLAEKMLTEGKVRVDGYGNVNYQPNLEKGKGKPIDLHLTSSMVKSLSGLVIYLRHLATEGDFIIIDEPELNLHPNTQLAFTWVIGLLIRSGFKVMISTHSDYIIRELNNLIMLGGGEAKLAKKIAKELDYFEGWFIEPKLVGAYLLSNGSIISIPLSPGGIEIATIDETIRTQNEISDTIYHRLINK